MPAIRVAGVAISGGVATVVVAVTSEVRLAATWGRAATWDLSLAGRGIPAGAWGPPSAGFPAGADLRWRAGGGRSAGC